MPSSSIQKTTPQKNSCAILDKRLSGEVEIALGCLRQVDNYGDIMDGKLPKAKMSMLEVSLGEIVRLVNAADSAKTWDQRSSERADVRLAASILHARVLDFNTGATSQQKNIEILGEESFRAHSNGMLEQFRLHGLHYLKQVKRQSA